MPKSFSSRKNYYLILGILSFVFCFFPFSSVLAIAELLKNAILFVPYALVALILVFFITLTRAFLWLASFFLDVATDPSFVALSYTNPAQNPIIKMGLNITQSFVNLLLVVVLVYTALSLALRLNETQATKMLIRLIVVALLVNFAPVFCGLVVDAANITMNYFLKAIEGGVGGIATQLGSFIDRVITTIWQSKVDLSERLGVLMMAITQMMINVALGTVFLLFACLFLVRYIVIWILVILAPIAFVAWIFPSGKIKGLWDMWFKNFVGWSIIGIPSAFFLYLSIGSFSLINAAFKQERMEMPGVDTDTIIHINEVFPYFVIIAFLYLGFGIGLQVSAMGSESLVRRARAYHKIGQRMVLKTAGRTTKAALKGSVGAVTKPFTETFSAQKEAGATSIEAFKNTVKEMPRAYWNRIKRRVEKAKETALRVREEGISRSVNSAYKGIKEIIREKYYRDFQKRVQGELGRKGKSEIKCPACGENVPEARYCYNCGVRLP